MKKYLILPIIACLAVFAYGMGENEDPPQCAEVFPLHESLPTDQGKGTLKDPYVISTPDDPYLDLFEGGGFIDESGIIYPHLEDPKPLEGCANFYVQVEETALPPAPFMTDDDLFNIKVDPDEPGQEVFTSVLFYDPDRKPSGYDGWSQAKKDAYDAARARATAAGIPAGIMHFGLMDPGLCKKKTGDCMGAGGCKACRYQIRGGYWSGSPWRPGRNWHPATFGHKIKVKATAPNDCCIYELSVDFRGGDANDVPRGTSTYGPPGSPGAGQSAGSWRGAPGVSRSYTVIVMPDCGQEITLSWTYDGCALNNKKFSCKTGPCTGQ